MVPQNLLNICSKLALNAQVCLVSEVAQCCALNPLFKITDSLKDGDAEKLHLQLSLSSYSLHTIAHVLKRLLRALPLALVGDSQQVLLIQRKIWHRAIFKLIE